MSIAEAEYVSLSASRAQVLWMWTQLTNYGFHFEKIPLYCDSKEAIAILCNPCQHSRTKHIDIRHHFINEQVEKGIVELFFVKTEYQLADMFNKSLSKDRFKYLVRRLGTNVGVVASLQQSLIHYHMLMHKLLSHKFPQCHQRSSKSNKIGEIVSLMKKRRLGAFKTSMSSQKTKAQDQDHKA
ncbi:hypothetical protein Tco_0735755 [Tanacetum coccineum]